MSQLLMRWIPEKLSDSILPEGFGFHRWKRGGDEVFTVEMFKKQWMEMRDPTPGDFTEKWFYTMYNDMRVPDDGFFLVTAPSGTICSSACIQYGQRDPESATVHEVQTDEKYRGLGLGRAIMIKVMNDAFQKGFPILYLTTDDWRIPAIKLYLHLGFLPVLYEPDMLSRWQALLEVVGEKSIKCISEDGSETVIK